MSDIKLYDAGMAKLVYAKDLRSFSRKRSRVRVPLPAPKKTLIHLSVFLLPGEQTKSFVCVGTRTAERCFVTRRNRELVASPR